MVHAWKYGLHSSAAVNKHFDSIHSTTNNTGVKEKAKNFTFVSEGQSMSGRKWDRKSCTHGLSNQGQDFHTMCYREKGYRN